jgi:hypothetical protein
LLSLLSRLVEYDFEDEKYDFEHACASAKLRAASKAKEAAARAAHEEQARAAELERQLQLKEREQQREHEDREWAEYCGKVFKDLPQPDDADCSDSDISPASPPQPAAGAKNPAPAAKPGPTPRLLKWAEMTCALNPLVKGASGGGWSAIMQKGIANMTASLAGYYSKVEERNDPKP